MITYRWSNKKWLFAAILAGGLIASCEGEQQKPAQQQQSATDDDDGDDDGNSSGKKKPKPKPSKTPDDECVKLTGDQSASDGSQDAADNAEFALADTTPSYVSDIKGLIDSHCVACHKPGNAKGGVELDTYAKAAAKAERSNIRVQAGTMPTAGALDSTKKGKFKAWFDGGYPEKSAASPSPSPSSSSSSTPSTGTGGSSSDPCDPSPTPSSSSSPVADDEFKDIMNPAKLKECHDKGQVFDRRSSGSCHEAKLVTGTCDYAKAVSLMGEGDSNVGPKKNQADGYEVDQCGETSSKHYVFWVKKSKSGTTLTLDVRINSISK